MYGIHLLYHHLQEYFFSILKRLVVYITTEKPIEKTTKYKGSVTALSLFFQGHINEYNFSFNFIGEVFQQFSHFS